MRSFLRLCDFLFVTRPLILIPAWSFFLIGARDGAGERLSTLPDWYGLASLTGILVAAYLLNQVFDRESDTHNDKCFYLSRGIFKVRTLVIMAMAFFLAASVAFHHTAAPQRLPLIAALVLSLTYSLPPVRLCARPLADLAANAIGYGGVAYVLGFRTVSVHGGLTEAIAYVLLVGATFVHTTILDVDGDRAAGKISSAVLLGDKASRALALLLHAGAVVTSLLWGNITAVLICALTMPIAIYTMARRSDRASALYIQANTLAVTIAAAYFFPLYAVVIVPLLLLSRFYYRRRFGITYPGPSDSA